MDIPTRTLKTALSLLLAAVTCCHALELHVSADAAPGGDGSSRKPFASLDDARQAVRLLNRAEGVVVVLAPGEYIMREGTVFSLEDSGTPGNPIIYRAEPGAVARLSAGVKVPAAALLPVTDVAMLERLRPEVRDRVRRIDLDSMGIKAPRFKDNFRGIELIEVFWNNERLPISRWPNTGYAKIEKVTDNGIVSPFEGSFIFREDEAPSRWTQAAREDGLWLRGFWRVPWVIEAARVGNIDAASRTITLAGKVQNGIGSKYHRAKDNGPGAGSGDEPWMAFNLVEEIDLPGEWAVHFPSNSLYLLPPEGEGTLIISDVSEPALAFREASHIKLENLTIDGSLGDGIRIEGGEGIFLGGCKVRNLARAGIVIRGGNNHTIRSCDVTLSGLEGIDITGGNRQTLEPGGHQVINNIVSQAGVYFPASALQAGNGPRSETVGNIIANNRIHDSANTGIQFAGNDNILEFNEIYRIGLGSSDLGCFYTTGGWTSRGNIVRNNFVHHSMNANSFYVDDGDSGDTFLSNVAYKTESGGFVGGGHDQTFRYNIIIESTRAMHVDSRGVSRKYTAQDRRLRGDLDSVPYQSPPWSDKYQELVHILEGDPSVPSGILIERNLFVNCETGLRKSGKEGELVGIRFEDNVESDDMNQFVDPANLNFGLKPDAGVFAAIPSFPNIDFSRIGVQPDEYRPVVPPRDMELLRTGRTDRGFDSQTDLDASNR